MLTDDQITSLWERMISAEVRSLYFAELASNYTRQKQIISGASFFLASGAAAVLIGKLPSWVAILLACITALLSAYSIARGLDGAARTMSKLQFSWSELASSYEALWTPTMKRPRPLASHSSSPARTISPAKARPKHPLSRIVWGTGRTRSYGSATSFLHESSPGHHPRGLAASAETGAPTSKATTTSPATQTLDVSPYPSPLANRSSYSEGKPTWRNQSTGPLFFNTAANTGLTNPVGTVRIKAKLQVQT